MTNKQMCIIINEISDNLIDHLHHLFGPPDGIDSEDDLNSLEEPKTSVDDLLDSINSISSEEELLMDLAQALTRLSFYEEKENYQECAKLKKKITLIQTKLNDI